MKKILGYILFVLLICISCNRSTAFSAFLLAIEEIMETDADSAYNCLLSFSDSVDGMTDEERMGYYVLLADASNKLYKPLPSDTILNDVVDYYDSHGTLNQRMKSRYLLGCRLRDDGDTPAAIRYYQEAVEHADTMDVDCDYVTLFSIYGQMAELFYLQYLEEKAIDAYREYSRYALKAGDTYNFIRGIEFQMQPYFLLNDTIKVLELTDSVYNLYTQNGMPDKASRVFYKSMYIHLDKGEYQKAKSQMDEFEKNSGLFENNRLTDPHYIRYYYAKGLYYLGVSKPDSAELFFRMLIPTDNKYDAYEGLTSLYRSLSNTDSTLKYSELRDNEFDRIFKGMQSDGVRQVSAMYNYDKLEHQKEIYLMESVRSHFIIWIVLFVFLILLLLASIGFIIYRKNKKNEMEIIKMRFINTLLSMDKLKADLNDLTLAYNELTNTSSINERKLVDLKNIINAKQEEIEYIEKVAVEYKNKYQDLTQENGLDKFRGSNIIHSIRMMYNSPNSKDVFVKNEESRLLKELKSCLPVFYHKINNEYNLSNQEKLTSILVLAGFSAKEIAFLLQTSISRISNIRKTINHKLFGETSALTLSDNLNKMATE